MSWVNSAMTLCNIYRIKNQRPRLKHCSNVLFMSAVHKYYSITLYMNAVAIDLGRCSRIERLRYEECYSTVHPVTFLK